MAFRMSLTLCVCPMPMPPSVDGCCLERTPVRDPPEGQRDVAARISGILAATSREQVGAYLRNSLLPSHTIGSYLRSATRSFIGINALSVILMFSGHTSVQHLVMLQ